MERKGGLIAKIKFWFGKANPIFNTDKYIIEYNDDFAYIYEKVI